MISESWSFAKSGLGMWMWLFSFFFLFAISLIALFIVLIEQIKKLSPNVLFFLSIVCKIAFIKIASRRITGAAQIDLFNESKGNLLLLFYFISLMSWIFSLYTMDQSLCKQSFHHQVLSIITGLWTLTPFYGQQHPGSALIRWLILIRLLFDFSPVTRVFTVCHLAAK